MAEKKTSKKQSKKAEAIAHVERLRAFAPAYYKKETVIKILRAFIELYVS